MFRSRFLLTVAIGAACCFTVSGAEASATPTFTYNAQTGVVGVQADLEPGETLVSWLIDGPQALSILAFQDGTQSQGSDWVQGYFDGKEQWIAITGDGITGSWDLALYDDSLDLNVFGQVEYALRFDSGGGLTGFTAVTAPSLTGDLDGDGFVGIADLNLVLGNWNQTIPPGDPLADPSGDGFVGIQDLNTVLGNWNAGTPPSNGANVPEPVSAWLVPITLLIHRRAKGAA